MKRTTKTNKRRICTKKSRCSCFGFGAYNLANSMHIQLHLPAKICYLSGSSKWFSFFCTPFKQLALFASLALSLIRFCARTSHTVLVIWFALCFCAFYIFAFIWCFNDHAVETSLYIYIFFSHFHLSYIETLTCFLLDSVLARDYSPVRARSLMILLVDEMNFYFRFKFHSLSDAAHLLIRTFIE